MTNLIDDDLAEQMERQSVTDFLNDLTLPELRRLLTAAAVRKAASKAHDREAIRGRCPSWCRFLPELELHR
jgi:hypothetical protein